MEDIKQKRKRGRPRKEKIEKVETMEVKEEKPKTELPEYERVVITPPPEILEPSEIEKKKRKKNLSKMVEKEGLFFTGIDSEKLQSVEPIANLIVSSENLLFSKLAYELNQVENITLKQAWEVYLSQVEIDEDFINKYALIYLISIHGILILSRIPDIKQKFISKKENKDEGKRQNKESN